MTDPEIISKWDYARSLAVDLGVDLYINGRNTIEIRKVDGKGKCLLFRSGNSINEMISYMNGLSDAKALKKGK